jgi:hypothetical protein
VFVLSISAIGIDINRAFVTENVKVEYSKSHNYGTGYFIFVLSLAICTVLLLMYYGLEHFVYALYFGQNVTIINSTNPTPFFSRQLAATENGTVYVVWVDKNNIYFTSSQDYGTKFGTPILLSNPNKLSSSPQIAASENGSVYVLWIDKNSTNEKNDLIFTRSNNSGKSFHEIMTLSRQNEPLLSPLLAATKNGSVYVVWVDKNNIYFTSSQDYGTKFGTPILLSNPNKLSSSPQIAASENGGVYVVWVDNNNATIQQNIVLRGSNDYGKSFHNEEKINKKSDVISLSPQIAATENGNVYVIWVWVDKNSTNGNTDIKFTSSADYGNNFQDRKKLSRQADIISSSPQIAATDNGSVYVAWVNKNSTDGITAINVRASSDRGDNFTNGIYLGEGLLNTPASSPQIAATDNGNAYVVWFQNYIQFKEILGDGSIFGRNVPLGNNTSLSFPQIATTKNGNIYVLWLEKNNLNKNSILIKRID